MKASEKTQAHLEILNKDLQEAASGLYRQIIHAKMIYYALQRPVANILLKVYFHVHPNHYNNAIIKSIDRFLLNEGRMFKIYVYKICNKLYPLKGSTICIPGVGYGRNLFQLAAFKPKSIVAFDLYDYPEEWEFIKKAVKNKFGVEINFLRGDINRLAEVYKKYFDFVVTDAVLEHVNDLPYFTQNLKKILKETGIFYASFGPVWYGPGGDHIYWGPKKIFDHLVLSKEIYQKNFNERFSSIEKDSTEGAFIVTNKLLSYLSVQKYFEILSETGFEKVLAFAKISTEAISLLRQKPEIHDFLDKKDVPRFDRLCSGLYLWLQ